MNVVAAEQAPTGVTGRIPRVVEDAHTGVTGRIPRVVEDAPTGVTGRIPRVVEDAPTGVTGGSRTIGPRSASTKCARKLSLSANKTL